MSRFPRALGRSCSAAAVVAAVTACGSASTPAAPDAVAAASAVERTIVVLGDSLAVSPSRTMNFVSHLREKLRDTAGKWTVRNEGVSGDTTAGGLRRLDSALAGKPDILILELGANDGLRGIPIDMVEKNLSAIIREAQSRRIVVLLCGMETPPINGWDYTVEFHRLYPRVAATYGIPLVPFLLEGVALNPEMNGEDSIHPNAAGAARIADTVWPYLRPLVQQAAATGPSAFSASRPR